jgi:hypothetical protein
VPATQIGAFEVAPATAAGTRYRALRPDVRWRFVEIGPQVDAAPYEVVHEEGAPDGAEGVTLIELFEVPDGADEEFLAAWHTAREATAGARGYLGTRLHRSAGPAGFRFVSVARWSSPLMVSRAAGRPDWQTAAALPFPAHAALYQVVG